MRALTKRAADQAPRPLAQIINAAKQGETGQNGTSVTRRYHVGITSVHGVGIRDARGLAAADVKDG